MSNDFHCDCCAKVHSCRRQIRAAGVSERPTRILHLALADRKARQSQAVTLLSELRYNAELGLLLTCLMCNNDRIHHLSSTGRQAEKPSRSFLATDSLARSS